MVLDGTGFVKPYRVKIRGSTAWDMISALSLSSGFTMETIRISSPLSSITA